MKKIFFIIALLPMALCAQNAEQEIYDNPNLSGSNYVAYRTPTTKLTPSPKGYEPFYVSHYARHGSRWLCDHNEYDVPVKALQKAKKYSKLTPEGEEVLRRLEFIQGTSHKRCGDLSSVGERQHHGIGKRMAQNFPEVFRAKNTQVDARSTIVRRCIISMIAECEELAAVNPNTRFHNDTSDSLQFYLNQDATPKMEKIQQSLNKLDTEWYGKLYKPERLMQYLFNDQQFVSDSLGSRKDLMWYIFNVARGMQSHDYKGTDLWYIFTKQEIFDMWRYDNISWYCGFGSSVENPDAPFSQYNLLENILNTADTIVNNPGFHGATMRFGHEVCVLPLACLMELGEAGAKVSTKDFDTLHEHFRNYNIFPMAGNVQLIFYRHKKGRGPVLVKALLNEKEVTIADLKTDRFPYYTWSDVEQYYRNKLNNYQQY